MKAVEFIEMQKQDIETHKDKVILSEVVAAMAEVLKSTPDAEIDHTKTAEDCYKQMYEHAKKNKSNNAYVFTPTGTFYFICDYLGIHSIESSPADAVTTTPKRRRLEDFF